MAEEKKPNPRGKAPQFDLVDETIIQMRLAKPGVALHEIAAAVGLSTRAVAERWAKPKVQEAIAFYSKKVTEILREAREKAARKIVALVDSPNANVALRACEDLIADALPAKKIKHEGGVFVRDAKTELERRLDKIAAAAEARGSPESN